MKKLFVIAIATAVAGCAEMPQQARYGNGSYAQPRDPSQWRVVSVTPVPTRTAAKVAARSPDGKPVEFSSSPAPLQTYATRPIYSQAPVYAPAPVYGSYGSVPVYSSAPVYGPVPVYAPAPVYAPQPAYYWPPVSLSLGFMFGRHWGGGYGGARFHGGRRW